MQFAATTRHFAPPESERLAELMKSFGCADVIAPVDWEALGTRVSELITCQSRSRPQNSAIYDPETLTIMTRALDRACNFLPAQFRDTDYMRKRLAFEIVRHLNNGERDPIRLADSAVSSIPWY
jgi:hypothetical protein